jgi:GAF domain-containing protein
MQLLPPTRTDLYTVLRAVVERIRRASGAGIISLYPFDGATRTFFSPCAIGIPEDGLLGSLPDMLDQLARYADDVAQGKAPPPDELTPQHYGINVWVMVTRKLLIARDAPKEIGSSFIRRHHIGAVVGMPLIAGDTLTGLLFLNFHVPPEQKKSSAARLDDAQLAELERIAGLAALEIDRACRAEERDAFSAACALAAILTSPPMDGTHVDEHGHGRLDEALQRLLRVTNFDGALIYRAGAQRGRLELAAHEGFAAAPLALAAPDEPPATEIPNWLSLDPLEPRLQQSGVHVVASLPLHAAGQFRGALLFLSRDALAPIRRAPWTKTLLDAAADMIAGALAAQHLVAAKDDTNRVLGALSRMNGALLRPGAAREQVLEALVQHLTDEAVPEFSFHFATVFLLGRGEQGATIVQHSAGAAIDENIDAAPTDVGDARRRVPRWAQQGERLLAPTDVLVYAAESWRIVVLGAIGDEAEEVIAGYPAEQLERRDVPAIRSDGTMCALAHAIFLADPARPTNGRTSASGAPPFTLDGDLFESSGHRDLLRVFVPFGLDASTRATGVLEAGYHRLKQRGLARTQIEALRACAAQVAIAIETARLYEDAKRHAEHLEIVTDVSAAIASSIDLDQTLRLIARNLARSVDASVCQIALYDEDGSAWYGAAASEAESLWRRQRTELPEPSILFEVLDRRQPLVVEDAQQSDTVNSYYAHLFGLKSLLALPLLADDRPIGAAILGQRDRRRMFTDDEIQRANGLVHQAAIAIQNARLHALEEEEHHIQKDVVLLGFGQWGQKGYQHLQTLKQFFNFKTHVVEQDVEGRREKIAELAKRVEENGDVLYWDSPANPARDRLRRELESSCYVITYIATPAATHLPVLYQYYDLSNVVVIEKPLGAAPEAYREFLAGVDGSVELVAADHYYFKLEVRLLQLLLTEEKTLKEFLDSVEEIEMELLEEKSLSGAAAAIGIIADMMPHAFAIISLFTPIDRINFSTESGTAGRPLLTIGRFEPLQSEKETYARLTTTFPHHGRTIRLVIDVGKGVENAKWIKLSGEKRAGGRRAFYKFDFGKGEAIDGTQTNLNAAVRPIRQPGVPDNAHLTMLRYAIEKKHPAVGILAIREAMRSNQHIQELEALANDLLAKGAWTSYGQGQRPDFSTLRAVESLDEARAADAPGVRVG